MSFTMEKEASRTLQLWLNDYRAILRQYDLNSYKMQSWGTQLRCQILLNQRFVNIEQIINFLDSINDGDILEYSTPNIAHNCRTTRQKSLLKHCHR